MRKWRIFSLCGKIESLVQAKDLKYVVILFTELLCLKLSLKVKLFIIWSTFPTFSSSCTWWLTLRDVVRASKIKAEVPWSRCFPGLQTGMPDFISYQAFKCLLDPPWGTRLTRMWRSMSGLPQPAAFTVSRSFVSSGKRMDTSVDVNGSYRVCRVGSDKVQQEFRINMRSTSYFCRFASEGCRAEKKHKKTDAHSAP